MQARKILLLYSVRIAEFPKFTLYLLTRISNCSFSFLFLFSFFFFFFFFVLTKTRALTLTERWQSNNGREIDKAFVSHGKIPLSFARGKRQLLIGQLDASDIKRNISFPYSLYSRSIEMLQTLRDRGFAASEWFRREVESLQSGWLRKHQTKGYKLSNRIRGWPPLCHSERAIKHNWRGCPLWRVNAIKRSDASASEQLRRYRRRLSMATRFPKYVCTCNFRATSANVPCRCSNNSHTGPSLPTVTASSAN